MVDVRVGYVDDAVGAPQTAATCQSAPNRSNLPDEVRYDVGVLHASDVFAGHRDRRPVVVVSGLCPAGIVCDGNQATAINSDTHDASGVENNRMTA